MLLDENTGETINLEEAKEYISEFENTYPDEVKSFFVGASHVQNILDQDNCIGIRIYNGFDVNESRMNQVLVGVDSDENDIQTGIIVEKLFCCPPNCGSGILLTDKV